jgi:hypothetical protein
MKSIHIHWLLLAIILTLIVPLPMAAGGAKASCVSNAVSVLQADDELDFSFYGKSLRIAKLQPVKVQSMGESDITEAWNKYKTAEADNVLSSLRCVSDDLGLNDWFVFELVRKYVDALLNASDPVDRMVLDHYLLVGLGYDVRLARTQRQLLLLVPIKQLVYEHQFVRVDGKEYYLFFDDEESAEENLSVIVACDPSKNDVGKGHSFSLLFEDSPLKVRSGEDHTCELDDGKIRLACTVNEGVMEMLRNYPMMDIHNYVTSVVLPQFQDSIVGQLKPQIEDMTQCEAADALLHFVQCVFGYEADTELHGHEKAYFIEENFYYDYNDCEDRSILYAFLVRSLLGLDVQIVEYPGHKCTAVRFTDCLTYGNGYYLDGEFYLICDPSYVGASIGKCMPEFHSMEPRVYIVKQSTSKDDDNRSPLHPKLDKVVRLPSIPHHLGFL